MTSRATWKPYTTHGDLDTRDRDRLPDSVFAFPRQRKEPLADAAHVKNALARFDQVEDVSAALPSRDTVQQRLAGVRVGQHAA